MPSSLRFGCTKLQCASEAGRRGRRPRRIILASATEILKKVAQGR